MLLIVSLGYIFAACCMAGACKESTFGISLKLFIHACRQLLLCFLQKTKGQSEEEWHEVQPRNQHNKQLQEKSSRSRKDQLVQDLISEQRRNASLAAKIDKLKAAGHELSQSLRHERGIHAKSEEQRHCMQNSLSMQREALASKERQLSQVMLCTAAADFRCPQCVCT